MLTDTCYGGGKDEHREEKVDKRSKEKKESSTKIHHHFEGTTLTNHHVNSDTCLPNLKAYYRKNLFCLDVITELVSALSHSLAHTLLQPYH